MRALHRLGHDLDVVVVEEAAVEVDRLVGPGLQHDLNRFIEPRRSLTDRHAEAVEVLGDRAAADAVFEPPAGDDVERGRVLRRPNRLHERDQGHARTQPNPRRLRRSRGGQDQRRRQHGELAHEVHLGQPGEIVAQSVGLHDLGDRVAVARRHVLPVRLRQLEEEPKLQRRDVSHASASRHGKAGYRSRHVVIPGEALNHSPPAPRGEKRSGLFRGFL